MLHNRMEKLKNISANASVFQTNGSDLTDGFIIPNKIDVIVTVETFLYDTVPENFEQIRGFQSGTAETEEVVPLGELQFASR